MGVSCVKVTGRPFSRVVAQSINVMVASKLGLDLWGGTGDNARPVLSASWSELMILLSADRGTAIELHLTTAGQIVYLNAYSNRVMSTLKLRGQARAACVTTLNSLATNTSS